MKRIINTLLICAFAMGSSFASSLVDSIAQPSHITLTRHDASGNMLSSSYADFGYYGDGKLKTFNYAYGDPDKTYSYDGDFLTKIRIKNGTGPVYFETFRYYYENDKVSNIYHDGDEYGITHSYRIGFTYDAYGRLEKKELFDYYNYYFNETDSLWSYWTYEYFDNGKTRKETMYEHPYSKEYEVISIETYRYNDDYRLISIQKDSATSPLTLTTYTYTDNGELESETKQNWEDGRWVNASKFVNVFDFEGRIEEHRMGEWSGNEWNLNKKALYVYDANGLCKNISIFRENEETLLARKLCWLGIMKTTLSFMTISRSKTAFPFSTILCCPCRKRICMNVAVPTTKWRLSMFIPKSQPIIPLKRRTTRPARCIPIPATVP